ncbi:MAG: hypothetical protein AUI93_06245 [Crenarchaeota archaeon 13_1_40CM_3_52_10]|nr:MAG: hypothetical protein AUI93_06245 [Crenarchaeota archaeon 13_1_40CM_3_52_10]
MFSRHGLVIGLSGLFRSPRIPLAISVESQGVEIAGSSSGSGLKTGDFSVMMLFEGVPLLSFR